MPPLLEGGEQALDAVRELMRWAGDRDRRRDGVLVPAGEVNLLPPVPRPSKVICVARNYPMHAAEAKREIPEHPELFVRFAHSLIGNGAPIQVPHVSPEVDWEGELAVIIGKGGRHIPVEGAYEHVAGYSVFNDVSVRDYQLRVQQFTAGKNFDATGPFGPALVTSDEVPDPHALRLELTVNGVMKQDASTAEMLFDIPTLLAHISEFTTLEPGDVIATGTPAGVGCVRTPPEYLQPGDICKVTIDGIGQLVNPVVAEPE